jgi:hypothetical protein
MQKWYNPGRQVTQILLARDRDMLNPKFPIVENQYQMTREWSVTLFGKFNRRIEEKRPGR